VEDHEKWLEQHDRMMADHEMVIARHDREIGELAGKPGQDREGAALGYSAERAGAPQRTPGRQELAELMAKRHQELEDAAGRGHQEWEESMEAFLKRGGNGKN
jgi:hypothetical protein